MLSKRLRKLREEKGLLQKDIAKILNIATSAYGYYEQGERDPGTQVLEILADFYDISIDYLMGRTDNRNESLPTDTELEEFLQKSNIKFDGAPLDDDDKEDIINFLRMVWKRKKQK